MSEFHLPLRYRVDYDPEAQAILVDRGQKRAGGLVVEQTHAYYWRTETALNHQWFVLNETSMLTSQANMDLLSTLRRGDRVVEVTRPKPESMLGPRGVKKIAVAAVILPQGVLFRSPYFNLESFKRKRADLREALRWLKTG